jgi:hypothetical protein
MLIGGSDPNEASSVSALYNVMNNSPDGGTPLCRHIHEIVQKIRAIEPQLRATGQKAAVIIATDGESSDGDVTQAMRPFKDLPVMVIVRLCTDDEKVEHYWNSVDQQLGKSLIFTFCPYLFEELCSVTSLYILRHPPSFPLLFKFKFLSLDTPSHTNTQNSTWMSLTILWVRPRRSTAATPG